MDDLNTIERRMQAAQVTTPPPATVSTPVADALQGSVEKIVTEAQKKVGDKKTIDKNAKALADVAQERLTNEIDRQRVENARKAADNKIDRKTLANELYKIKQESKRLKKEQRHLSAMQKQRHEQDRSAAYWGEHSETLLQYGMKQGSSRIACNILLWLDGVKSFFTGLGKVSDAIVKALKWVLIIGGVVAVLMIVPVTRNWLLELLGFIKK